MFCTYVKNCVEVELLAERRGRKFLYPPASRNTNIQQQTTNNKHYAYHLIINNYYIKQHNNKQEEDKQYTPCSPCDLYEQKQQNDST